MSYIENTVSSNLVTGTENADTIVNSGQGAIIQALGGDDSISNTAADVGISADEGNDTITNSGANALLFGGAGNDSIRTTGTGSTINGEYGNDTITASGTASRKLSNVYIYDTIGNNNFTVEHATNSTVYAYNYSDGQILNSRNNDNITFRLAYRDNSVTSHNDTNVSINASGTIGVYDGTNVSIYAGSSADRITISGGDGNKVETGSYADSIVNSGTRTYINTDSGNDTITNSGESSTIYAGFGDNIITNTANNVSIGAGYGNDIINNSGDSVRVDGGDGNDTVTNSGENFVYVYQDGNDSISGLTNSSTVSLAGVITRYSTVASGNNVIVNVGNSQITLAGAATLNNLKIVGDYYDPATTGRYIFNTVEGASIQGTAYNDSINNYHAQHVTIDALDGNDSILSGGGFEGYLSIDAGDGNDTVEASGLANTIHGGKGDDYIYTADDKNLLYGDEGNDTINSDSGNNVTINGGDGNDSIKNDSDNSLVDAGAGNDTVRSNGNYSTVLAGDGNDLVDNKTRNTSIDGGAGDDIILNDGGYLTMGDDVTIRGGAGDDSIINSGGTDWNSSLNSNTDEIIWFPKGSIGLRPLLDGGAGNDLINNYLGTNGTILGGAGNDSIANSGSNTSIDAGDGNDFIENTDAKHVLDNPNGSWSDTVSSGFQTYDIYPDAGKHVTITGGKGNDTIDNYASSVTFKYSTGDGNDSIRGMNSTSQLVIDNGEGHYKSVVSGDDVLIGVGDAIITLAGAAALDTLLIDGIYDGELDTSPSSTTALNVNNTVNNTLITGTAYNDTITNSGSNVTINALGGNDTIYSSGNRAKIDSGAGNNLISLGGGNEGSNIVFSGNTTVQGFKTGWDSGSDTIYGNTGSDPGVDFKTNGLTFYDGSDTLTLPDVTTTAKINVYYEASNSTGHNVYIAQNDWYQVSNSDLNTGEDIYFVGTSATHNHGLDFSGVTRSLNVTLDTPYEANEDSIWIANVYSVRGGAGNTTIIGTTDSDTILTGTGATTIQANAGDDFINISNTAANLITYTSGDGNDLINGFNATSTLSISGGTYSTTTSGNDLILTVGTGSITLAGAATLSNPNIIGTLSGGTETPDTLITNAVNNTVVNGTTNDDNITNTGSRVTINALAGNDTISNSGANANVDAAAGNDTITNSGNGSFLAGGMGNDRINNNNGTNVTMMGGAGNDSIFNTGANSSISGGTGNEYVSNQADRVTIGTDAGDDQIFDTGNNNSIDGGQGNDYISSTGNNVTITGGQGRDTINAYGTNNVINYVAGYGNDLINGFNATSTLSITGTYSTVASGNDLILTVGNDSITLTGAATLDNVNIVGTYSSIPTTGGINVNSSVNNTLITGTFNDDTITNSGASVTIQALTGNDTISNTGANANVDAAAGNDLIRNTANNVTIIGGTGDDTINTSGTNSVLYYRAGDGNDLVTGLDATSTYFIVDGTTDYLFEDNNNMLIVVGTDTITLVGAAISYDVKIFTISSSDLENPGIYVSTKNKDTLITGTPYNDKITNTGARVTIDALAGDDYIGANNSNKSSINGGDGDDIINSDGNDSTITGGAGNDSINSYGDNGIITGGTGNDSIYKDGDNVSITGDTGNDYIYNYGRNSTVLGGEGTDTIISSGTYVIVNGGADNDNIHIGGGYGTVYGGAGDDTIENDGSYNRIFGGTGSDYITNNSTNVTLDSGDGNDYIQSRGSSVSINGGAGNDTIENKVVFPTKDITIRGGTGDDLIYKVGAGTSNNVVYKYELGDGNDTIKNFNETSTLSILDGAEYSSVVSGDDVIVTVGNGSILLEGAASLSAISIINTEVNAKLPGGTRIIPGSISATLDSDDRKIYVGKRGATLAGYTPDKAFVVNEERLLDLIDRINDHDFTLDEGKFYAKGQQPVVLEDIDTSKGTFVKFEAADGKRSLFGWSPLEGGVVDGSDIEQKQILFGGAPNGSSTITGGKRNDSIYADADDLVNLSEGYDKIYRTHDKSGGLTIDMGDGSTATRTEVVEGINLDNDKIKIDSDNNITARMLDGKLALEKGDTRLSFAELGSFADADGLKVDTGKEVYTLRSNYDSGISNADFFWQDNNDRYYKAGTDFYIVDNADNRDYHIGTTAGNMTIDGFEFGTEGDAICLNSVEGLNAGGNDVYVEGPDGKRVIISGGAGEVIKVKDPDNNTYVAELGKQLTYNDDVEYYGDLQGETGCAISVGADYGGSEVAVYLNGARETNGRSKTYMGVNKIDASAFTGEASLVGAELDDYIIASQGDTSLWGGNGGNDILVGTGYGNTFFYTKGDGNDEIRNAADGDVINLGDITLDDISSALIMNSGVKLDFKDGGNLTLSNAADVTFKLGDGSSYSADYNSHSWQSK